MKIKVSIISLLFLFSVGASSQKLVGELLNAGLDDANKLAKAYLQPYGDALGVNLNSGWYTSAAPHKILGFDVTLMGTYTMMPASALSFDVAELGLTNFNVSSSSSIAPTMAGKVSASQLVTLTPKVQGGSYAEFALPNGSGNDVMVTPMLQAAVGLPLHSEIIGRFMPETQMGSYGKVGLWGIGIKHSVKEYVPFFKRVPFLKMSVLGGYTNFSGALSLPDNNMLDKGVLDISSAAYTGRFLLGANFPFVALYTGVGYGNAVSDFDISGAFNGASASSHLLGLSYNSSAVDFNAGVRFRLGLLALHADYSVGDYQMITAGLGVSFR